MLKAAQDATCLFCSTGTLMVNDQSGVPQDLFCKAIFQLGGPPACTDVWGYSSPTGCRTCLIELRSSCHPISPACQGPSGWQRDPLPGHSASFSIHLTVWSSSPYFISFSMTIFQQTALKASLKSSPPLYPHPPGQSFHHRSLLSSWPHGYRTQNVVTSTSSVAKY